MLDKGRWMLLEVSFLRLLTHCDYNVGNHEHVWSAGHPAKQAILKAIALMHAKQKFAILTTHQAWESTCKVSMKLMV